MRMWIVLMVLMLTGCGGVLKKRVRVDVPPTYSVAKTASLEQLVELINKHYAAINSLSVSDLKLKFQSHSKVGKYTDEYRSANGYFVAQEPNSIYVNILNPLTKSTLAAMAAHGQEFQMWIPRENKYFKGETDVYFEGKDPLYNVRPQHFLNGIMVEKIPAYGSQQHYFLEEVADSKFQYYVIGIVGVEGNSSVVELIRKLWIERGTLHLVKQHYYKSGELISAIDYNGTVELGGVFINTAIDIHRKREGYSILLKLARKGIKLNPPIREGTFRIVQPPGSILEMIGSTRSN